MLRASLLAIAVVVSGLPAQANWMENLLRGGKYPSAAQARTACNEWASKGPKVRYRTLSLSRDEPRFDRQGNPGKMVEGTTRRCDWEEETKQFLGYQAKGYKDGEEIKGEHYGDPFDFHSLSRSKRFEVKRNFRY